MTMSDNLKVKEVGMDKTHSISLEGSISVAELLDRLDKNPEEVVVKKNEKIVSEGEKVGKGDNVVIIPVVSGG